MIRLPAAAPAIGLYRVDDLPDSIASFITTDPETGEWIWTGRIDRDGYGRIGNKGVHREVYKLLVGPISPGLELDHVKAWGCSCRRCCSPWHLEPVTRLQNVMRGTSFAAVNAVKQECIHGHPFDLFGTYYRPNGHRDCRACIRRRVREYQQRKRAETVNPMTARTRLGQAA